jgi:hypothetical protein
VSSSIVLIGPAEAIPSLRERLSSGAEVRAFTDTEAVQALEFIVRARPAIVAIEHEFSSTSRGAALVDRIKDDESLGTCEIRVIAYDGATRPSGPRPASGRHPVTAATESAALDSHGTRRVPRVRIRDGIEVMIDGNSATLLSLSLVGCMVFSPKMLKPNQRVRVTMSDGNNPNAIRCTGSVVWAAFEMPKGQPPRYRAGISFSTADTAALQAYSERYKKTGE